MPGSPTDGGIVEKHRRWPDRYGLPCSMGHPRNISGLATATEGPGFSTPLGMVRYGFATSRQERRPGLFKEMIRGIFVR